MAVTLFSDIVSRGYIEVFGDDDGHAIEAAKLKRRSPLKMTKKQREMQEKLEAERAKRLKAKRKPRKINYGDEELIDWFRDKARASADNHGRPTRMLNRRGSTNNLVGKPQVGKMYFYAYQAKHADKLPYWDKFPCIFMIGEYQDGFLGMNMHYLPVPYRARLMDKLYSTLSNKSYDDTTKLKINYKILAGAAKFKYFKPCIKRYLYSYIRSGIMEVHVKEWEYVLFLPLARFQKTTAQNVWEDSKSIISGNGAPYAQKFREKVRKQARAAQAKASAQARAKTRQKVNT